MTGKQAAFLGMVICAILVVATWQQGDLGACVWFAFCCGFFCGFFFNEQLTPTSKSTRGKRGNA